MTDDKSNTGKNNTGGRNTGDNNTGNRNAGNWNAADYHVGCFNTITAETAYYFNTPALISEWSDAERPNFIYGPSPTTWVSVSNMTEAEKEEHPEYKTTGGYLRKNNMREEWAKAWAGASDADKELLYALPNFDAKVFKEITGIDVGEPKKTIVIDGVKYELKEIKE